MDDVVALRPFAPAKDFEVSKRFYRALEFSVLQEDANVAIFEQGGFSFILQNFYVEALAANFMIQLMVRDVDGWWRRRVTGRLEAEFGVRPPRGPAMQSWGLRVGFLFDPSGVLWHVTRSAA